MTPTLVSLVNRSKRTTDAECRAMVHAVGVQLARDVGPEWGPVPALEAVPSSAEPTLGATLCTMSDTPDEPGAAGYHAEENGEPYIKVFTFEGTSALEGAQATSVTFSHEACELVGDAPANRWCDRPDGFDFALELSDPVEGDTYEIDGVSVSNFVYRAYFDPQSKPGERLDHMGILKKPFTMSPGGYLIKRTEPGMVSQIFAAHLDHDCHVAAPGIVVVFGKDYPEHKKAAKVAKAARRRGCAPGRHP